MTLALFCLILLRTFNSNSVSGYAQRSPFIHQRRYMSPIDWGWAPLWRNTWCILHWLPLQTDPPPGNPQLRISCGGLWRSVPIFNLERHVCWGHLPRCSEYLGCKKLRSYMVAYALVPELYCFSTDKWGMCVSLTADIIHACHVVCHYLYLIWYD